MTGFVAEDTRGVSVVHWTPDEDPTPRPGRAENFGDYLGPLIVDRLAPASTGSHDRTLVAVGSIVHAAPRGATVWGSGINAKVRRHLPAHADELDVRAVRGPLTRAALLAAGASVPPVFGDPGLLVPRVFPEALERPIAGRGGVVIIPNLHELERFAQDPRMVSPLADLWEIVDAIRAADLVVSSSLHGGVLADAFGIPARFVVSDAEHAFKYGDYLLGTGRAATRVATSIDEALEMGGHEPAEFDSDALRASFPADLWEDAESRAVAPAGTAEGVAALRETIEFTARYDARDTARGTRLADSIVSLCVLPCLTRFAASVSPGSLESLVAPVAARLADRPEVTAFPWSNAAVAALVRAGDLTEMRRVSLTAARGAVAYLETVAVDDAAGTVTVHGQAVPAPAHLSARGARVILRDGDGRRVGSLDAPTWSTPARTRWTATLDRGFLRERGPVSLDFAWVVGGEEKDRGPVQAPVPATGSHRALSGFASGVRIKDNGDLIPPSH